MSKIYLTSDLHFNHNKSFIYEPRGFNNIEEMNETIIDNWNSIVRPNDIVYVLGDLMLGGNNIVSGINLLFQLNGKIKIILGNHDTINRIKAYNDYLFPQAEVIGYATMLKGKYTFYLSHFPTRVTNFPDCYDRKTICLCGHSHTQDRWADEEMGCYHVELDAHECFPVSLDSIIEDIKIRKVKINERCE